MGRHQELEPNTTNLSLCYIDTDHVQTIMGFSWRRHFDAQIDNKTTIMYVNCVNSNQIIKMYKR